MSLIGQPLTRVDGRAKVTGAAKYSAEFEFPNLAYAVMAQSTIPNGRISAIDTVKAERTEGVLAVLTPANAMKLPDAPGRLSLLQDDRVHYNGQPVAVVIAGSLHAAWHAASLIQVQYEHSIPKLDFKAGFPSSYTGSHVGEPGDLSWGNFNEGMSQAEIRLDATYTTPIQHHNPMEPQATIAHWESNRLTLHDSSQNVFGVRDTISKIFNIPANNVRVIAKFVGGGFGCKGQVWSHLVLAVMAAKHVNRPVKLVLERPQMFGPVGARPRTYQQITLGATRQGKLTAIKHQVHAHTSVIEDYLESSAFPTRVMYACPNVTTIHRIVPLNLGTPTYMRAPGVATGTYALEVAMDELAYELKTDPLELRLVNYTEVDPHTKQPFTEKSLRECYQRAAERFGWSKRNPEPRSTKRGHELIGWGMATETYPAVRMGAGAVVRLQPDGKMMVASGTEDIGTGMYTIMTQVASDVLGIPPHLIEARVGDTTFPQAPLAAGSMSTSSVMPAVQAAATKARSKLFELAVQDADSPVYGANASDVQFKDGKIFRKSSPERAEHFTTLLARHGSQTVEAIAQVAPEKSLNEYSRHSFGAIFAEVAVDEQLGMVRVPRIVAVYDVGKILNEKTARSQFIGGIVWGVSLALYEDTHIDSRNGRVVNANLEKYLVPANADIGEIDVSTTNIPDFKLDSVGARGIGEIGITGTGAAVANAIYHATGKRIRDLPITPDKLL